MSREVHVQFCERAGVPFPCATHLVVTARTKDTLQQTVKPVLTAFLDSPCRQPAIVQRSVEGVPARKASEAVKKCFAR